ncbi:hypothetical protein [Pseudomonas sp. TWR3-1-1]|uniref:hypothetical protein n=1 Tax=Pseudomonas sp. TWR3-1-1 TaxID=2804633 RepID=UPI003CEB3E95
MSEQADWEVMLSGNPQVLRHISEQPFPQDYIRVWGGIDHWNDCLSDHFSFNSIYFNGLTENEVWLVAYELISLLNGASELFERNYQKHTIHAIALKEVRLNHRERVQISGLLKRPRALNPMVSQKQLINGLKTSTAVGLTILATENEDVYLLLKFLDLNDGWVGYYKLLDTIKTLEKKKGIKAVRVAAQETKFRNTANNYELSGFDGRHGFLDNANANTAKIMTLDEGHKFITGVVKSYLELAYPKLFKFSE